MTEPGARSFYLSAAEAEQQLSAEGGIRWKELATRGTLSVEIYAPRGSDPQTPHTRDEIYVVVSGSGEFEVEGRRRAFTSGDLLFVAAGVEHRFENFSDDLVVWVIFF